MRFPFNLALRFMERHTACLASLRIIDNGIGFAADNALDIGHPDLLLATVDTHLERYHVRLLRSVFLLSHNCAILNPLDIFIRDSRDTMTSMQKIRKVEVEVQYIS